MQEETAFVFHLPGYKCSSIMETIQPNILHSTSLVSEIVANKGIDQLILPTPLAVLRIHHLHLAGSCENLCSENAKSTADNIDTIYGGVSDNDNDDVTNNSAVDDNGNTSSGCHEIRSNVQSTDGPFAVNLTAPTM